MNLLAQFQLQKINLFSCIALTLRHNMDAADSQSHQKPGRGWYYISHASNTMDWGWMADVGPNQRVQQNVFPSILQKP